MRPPSHCGVYARATSVRSVSRRRTWSSSGSAALAVNVVLAGDHAMDSAITVTSTSNGSNAASTWPAACAAAICRGQPASAGAHVTVFTTSAAKGRDARDLGADEVVVSTDAAAMQGSMEFDPLALLIGRKSLASAGSGGRRGTREMLDFCAEHGITAEVEVLPARDVAEALARLKRNDVRYRFVLDMRRS
jgi:D-arabinose 1-dehydrogenase-like Zn-dependent alcohol dehydrogenase